MIVRRSRPLLLLAALLVLLGLVLPAAADASPGRGGPPPHAGGGGKGPSEPEPEPTPDPTPDPHPDPTPPPGTDPDPTPDPDPAPDPDPTGRLVPIKLLATNDIHGQLFPPADGYGGIAYLATHLRRVRDAHPNTLYVDTGDATGGTSGLSRRFGDEPTIEALNAMDLDVQAVGNHEFDYGTDELLRRYHGGCWLGSCSYRGGTPYPGASWQPLAANVEVRATGATIFPATWMTEVDGVRLGFVGVTSIGEILPTGNEGLDLRAWDTAIDRAVPELRDAGADVVVVLRHVGTPQQTDVNACDGWVGAAANHARSSASQVDVVVDAHTHAAYVCDVPGAPLTTQAFHSTLMYTEIDLVVDTALGRVVERSAVNRWVTHDVGPDPQVQAIIDRYLGWR